MFRVYFFYFLCSKSVQINNFKLDCSHEILKNKPFQFPITIFNIHNLKVPSDNAESNCFSVLEACEFRLHSKNESFPFLPGGLSVLINRFIA